MGESNTRLSAVSASHLPASRSSSRGQRTGGARQHKGAPTHIELSVLVATLREQIGDEGATAAVSGWQQALTLLLAVIPGFVYQGTRSRLRGPTPDDREIGVQILRALAGSGFAALAYVVVLGPALTKAVTRPVDSLEHPCRVALVLIVLIFLVPMAAAFLA